MKTLPLLLLPLLLCACGESGPATTETSMPAHDPATRKQAIDALLDMAPEQVSVYARVPGTDSLVRISNEAFPEAVTTTYNVLRDSSGQVLLVIEAPFSESGDWHIELAHYFDADGRTFAFERRASFFNSVCTDGTAHELATRYYASDGRETGSILSLKDETGNDLARAECQFPYDYPYTMYPSSAELAKDTGLPLDR